MRVDLPFVARVRTGGDRDHAEEGVVGDDDDDDNDDDYGHDDDDNKDDDGGCGGRDGHYRMRTGRGHDDRTNTTIK